MAQAASSPSVARREAVFSIAYFVVCFAYLFLHQEGEALHWLTLV
jgi:hypothetical protein